MEKKLDVVATLKEGFTLGLKNLVPLILLVILYCLTLWIPYLNVGTTIGMYKAVISMSKGEKIDPLSIFDKSNFAHLGSFFLLMGFLTIGIIVAGAFMFIPALIIGIAWDFALYFMIDKKVSPLKSLSLSYDATLGEKWRIFAVVVLLSIILSVATAIFGAIASIDGAFFAFIGGLLVVAAVIVGAAYAVAVEALMYKHFSEKADALIEGHHCCCHHAEPAPEIAPEA